MVAPDAPPPTVTEPQVFALNVATAPPAGVPTDLSYPERKCAVMDYIVDVGEDHVDYLEEQPVAVAAHAGEEVFVGRGAEKTQCILPDKPRMFACGNCPRRGGMMEGHSTGGDLVLVPVGVPRGPGMTRDELLKENASSAQGVAEACAERYPQAVLGMIANPVEPDGDGGTAASAAPPDPRPKAWAIVSGGDANCAGAVLEALGAGHKRLAILAIVSTGPVSQPQVLRAMEYGDVYAAAAELDLGPGCDDSQWTAFTHDPRQEAAGGSAFAADGAQARKEIQGFLSRESLLTLVAKRSLSSEAAEGEDGAGGLGQGLADASKAVTILYTSDTEPGEECLKAVAWQCRNGGYAYSAVRCSAPDAFDVGALSSEPFVVFCVATAGKGEFPSPCRERVECYYRKFEVGARMFACSHLGRPRAIGTDFPFLHVILQMV